MPIDTPTAADRTFLACVGDANDPMAWSSTPYHFLAESRRQGVIGHGLPLRLDAPWVKRSRLAWNLLHVLKGNKPRGFQYSPTFLERFWEPVKGRIAGGRVVNQFQFFPPSVVADASVEKWYYVDGTMRQLVDYYGDRLDPRYLDRIMVREAEGYRSAKAVMAMSRFAADSVVKDYGVDPDRVHVVVPGANIAADVFDELEKSWEPWRDPATGRRRDAKAGDPLRMVFVGRAVGRKGLDRLLGALAIARRAGSKATLRVIGLTAADVPEPLRHVDGVEWLGLVSRKTDAARLYRLIAECDVGVLLSRAEFSAIALREYLALGLAVIGPNTGGCNDLMWPEACWAFKPEDPDEAIGELIASFETDREAVEQKRSAGWARRRDALWEPSVRVAKRVMAGDGRVL